MVYLLSIYVEDPLFDSGQQRICVSDSAAEGQLRLIPFEGTISLEPLQMMMKNAGSLCDAVAIISKQLTAP